METTPVVLTFTVLFSILFFLVGGLITWIVKDHYDNSADPFTFHPEMFDNEGNLIRDTLIAFDFPEDDEDD